MPYKKYPPLSKKKIKTIPIKDRKSEVNADNFAHPFEPGSDFNSFLKSLPDQFASKDLIECCNYIKTARKKDKPIILGLGTSALKAGVNPVIIDLMERGWISAVAVDGAFMIHDFEIALTGKTFENMQENLHKGTYGNTEETGLFLNIALKEGFEQNLGAGEAVGHYLISSSFSFNRYSILYKAYKLNIPITVHPAIGTDFIHYHPQFDGSVSGTMAETDFLLFSSVVSKMSEGGIYINIGSSRVLPGVFLKALAFCTAQCFELKNFYAAVFDRDTHNTLLEDIVSPAVLNGGKGYYFTGHHEIMIPLLAASLVS